MNKEEALVWLNVCISNEQLDESKQIAWAKTKQDLKDEDKLAIIKESEWRIEILNELKEYVKRYLR